MLFFWEEEAVRWRLLDEEEVEIRRTMEMVMQQAQGDRDEHLEKDLNFALRRVQMRRGLKPSERGAGEGQGRTSGTGGQGGRNEGQIMKTQEGTEPLPQYKP